MFYFFFDNFAKTNRQNREAMDRPIIKMGIMSDGHFDNSEKTKNVWNIFVFV